MTIITIFPNHLQYRKEILSTPKQKNCCQAKIWCIFAYESISGRTSKHLVQERSCLLFCLFSTHHRLKILNLSSNALTVLPPLNEIEDLNKLQELYLTQNSLHDDCIHVIAGYHRLKILHLAYNELTHIEETYVSLSILISYFIMTWLIWLMTNGYW